MGNVSETCLIPHSKSVLEDTLWFFLNKLNSVALQSGDKGGAAFGYAMAIGGEEYVSPGSWASSPQESLVLNSSYSLHTYTHAISYN